MFLKIVLTAEAYGNIIMCPELTGHESLVLVCALELPPVLAFVNSWIMANRYALLSLNVELGINYQPTVLQLVDLLYSLSLLKPTKCTNVRGLYISIGSVQYEPFNRNIVFRI